VADKNGLRAKLDEVNSEIASKNAVAQEKWQAFESARDQFAAAGNEANDTNSEQFKTAEKIHREYAEVTSELKEKEAVRDGIFRMLSVDGGEQKGPESFTPDAPLLQGKTLAERALESQEYKQALESGVFGREKASFNVKLADLSIAEAKALITGASDTSAGAFVVNDVKPYVPQPRRMTKILDLITIGQTDGDTVEYPRQTTFTNVAAETAEATATTTGTKPEATIAFEKVTAAVKTIAHWVPATRRALSDAGQLRTLIESQLRYGLEYRLESQVVSGAGTGETLTGITNTSNILTQAKGGDSVADAIHKAITQIRLGFIEPNGIALHPNDWEVIRLSKGTANDHYLLGNPGVVAAEQIWGLPVAVTPAVADDTGIVGDFRYATLWMREGAQVYASDSHDDFFVKNLVAILAELRCAFGVTMPQAFCKVTGLD
jgi:HK97 family phage major capsid protein